MKRQRSIAGPVLLSSLLAGAFGYWLGLRRSPPPPPPSAPIVTMLACPPAGAGEGPATATAEPPKHRATVSIEKPQGNQLPELAAKDDHREELLHYIRERASALQDCVPGGHDRMRLTIRVDMGGHGAVERVQVVDGDPEHTQVGHCVASRMQSWVLPQQWVQARQSLLMSVVL